MTFGFVWGNKMNNEQMMNASPGCMMCSRFSKWRYVIVFSDLWTWLPSTSEWWLLLNILQISVYTYTCTIIILLHTHLFIQYMLSRTYSIRKQRSVLGWQDHSWRTARDNSNNSWQVLPLTLCYDDSRLCSHWPVDKQHQSKCTGCSTTYFACIAVKLSGLHLK